MNNKISPQCASCRVKNRACLNKNGKGPKFCPTNNREIIERAGKEFEKREIREFARMSSIQEGECFSNRHIKPFVPHPVKPRVQEICEFAKKMGYKKLGIAFCAGLFSEAGSLSRILKAQGFNVVSIVCKAGCIPKEVLGLKEEEKIIIGEFESMCNPIAQAYFLNEENTDFNILVGLCVGHDSLFFKYSEAFTTVLIAKDRVLAHNPAGALYTMSTYYERLLTSGFDSQEDIK
jgi:uncharacterized metal-binding protein